MLDVKSKISGLTIRQIKALKFFLQNPALTSNASGAQMKLSGRELGGIHSSLTRNKLIEPLFRNDNRSYTFRATKEIQENKSEILKLIEEIEQISG